MFPNSTGKLFRGKDHFLCIIYKLISMLLAFRRIYLYTFFCISQQVYHIKDIIKPWNEIYIQHACKQNISFNIKLFALQQTNKSSTCVLEVLSQVWKVIQVYGLQNLLSQQIPLTQLKYALHYSFDISLILSSVHWR